MITGIIQLYLKGEPVIKGDEKDLNVSEFSHQRKWVDACKGLIVKNIEN